MIKPTQYLSAASKQALEMRQAACNNHDSSFGSYVMTTSECERPAGHSCSVEGGVVDLRSGDDGPILPGCDPHQAP